MKNTLISHAAQSPVVPVGRFAPSPTGRMHLGNVFTALMSWLSVKSRGGRWVLRIEDLDSQRSRREWSRLIEDDLAWIGLDWDEGGLDDRGPHGPYSQSLRGEIYLRQLARLKGTGCTYPCTCTRADIMATQAPHASDGRVVYGGRCRPAVMPQGACADEPVGRHSTRLWVPDNRVVEFSDRLFGPQSVNLARECGDFILHRADGAWAYQLAVVVDDALMGINEVVRGSDLLMSAAQQIYLSELLGFKAPQYAHVPLLCNAAGQRLSKRDRALDMEHLRAIYTPGQLLGQLARIGGLIDEPAECTLDDLVSLFDWNKIPARMCVTVDY
ncbi:MAG: tRNA glutamyl-Q(34) synthetase GluQRS [Duncaniella sp.]|nr:tRNA glutamyl-Q(34) synthetase GluQRS [Duncaniella sp.]